MECLRKHVQQHCGCDIVGDHGNGERKIDRMREREREREKERDKERERMRKEREEEQYQSLFTTDRLYLEIT